MIANDQEPDATLERTRRFQFKKRKALLRSVMLCGSWALLFGVGRTGETVKPGKDKDPLMRLVRITEVNDLDDIRGFIPIETKPKVRIVLGNMLPLSKWPKKLTKAEADLKERALKRLRELILDKELYLVGIQTGDILHGDLLEPLSAKWNPGLPSGKPGWFTLHINVALIEDGYTVLDRDPARLEFPLPNTVVRDRKKYYSQAEKHAVAEKKGLWKEDMDGLARRLKEISAANERK